MIVRVFYNILTFGRATSMVLLFWISFFLLLYVYIGYPIVVRLLAGKIDNSIVKNLSYEPFVSILISAYNEETDIANTIRNKLELDYPKCKFEVIVVSDESSDRTDEIVQSIVEKEKEVQIRLFRQSPRKGKTSGLNLLVPEAKGEIIVFSDANSIYDKNALRILVSNFYDSSIGYVTGKMVYVNSSGAMIGDGCSAYMRYENWLRKYETLLGSVVGVDGGIDAMRKTLYQALNADQLPDFVQPLKVVENGFRVAYEERAILKEQALSNAENEYRMRVRVSLRALWALHDMKQLLNPMNFKIFYIQLISHKLFRYLAFIPQATLLMSNVFLIPMNAFYLLFFITQVLFFSLAWMGHASKNSEENAVWLTLPYYFTLLNISSMHATWRYLKGEKQIIWNPRSG